MTKDKMREVAMMTK